VYLRVRVVHKMRCFLWGTNWNYYWDEFQTQVCFTKSKSSCYLNQRSATSEVRALDSADPGTNQPSTVRR